LHQPGAAGSGLGSSSAALLTGMLGANAILGEPFSREDILKLAIETEGHPDNVAPAMLEAWSPRSFTRATSYPCG